MLRRSFIEMSSSLLALIPFGTKFFQKESPPNLPESASILATDKDTRQHLADYVAYMKSINKALGVLHIYGGFTMLECEQIRKDICKNKADQWVFKFMENTNKKTYIEAMLVWNSILVSFRCLRVDGFEILEMNDWYDEFCMKLEMNKKFIDMKPLLAKKNGV